MFVMQAGKGRIHLLLLRDRHVLQAPPFERQACSPGSTPHSASQLTPPCNTTPSACLQFNSCAFKSTSVSNFSTLPQYYSTNVPLLPYRAEWGNQHQTTAASTFPYNQFNYEQTKPLQISNFIPSPNEKPFKEYYNSVEETNISGWYICQNKESAGESHLNIGPANLSPAPDHNSVPITPNLHQVLAAGF